MSTTRERLRPDMNVTPLVDVVLVLLIIFMVIAPRIEPAAKVKLPAVMNAESKSAKDLEPITVTVGADGRRFIGDEPRDAQALSRDLRARYEADARRKVVLRGDASARYADVRAIFKECQAIGFPGVSLAVSEEKTPEDR